MQPALTEPSLSLTRQALSAQGAPRKGSTRCRGRTVPHAGRREGRAADATAPDTSDTPGHTTVPDARGTGPGRTVRPELALHRPLLLLEHRLRPAWPGNPQHPHRARPVRRGPLLRESGVRHHGGGTTAACPAAVYAPQPISTAAMSPTFRANTERSAVPVSNPPCPQPSSAPAPAPAPGRTDGTRTEIQDHRTRSSDVPETAGQRGTMSGAPSRAASAVRSSGCRWDSRSASTRFS